MSDILLNRRRMMMQTGSILPTGYKVIPFLNIPSGKIILLDGHVGNCGTISAKLRKNNYVLYGRIYGKMIGNQYGLGIREVEQQSSNSIRVRSSYDYASGTFSSFELGKIYKVIHTDNRFSLSDEDDNLIWNTSLTAPVMYSTIKIPIFGNTDLFEWKDNNNDLIPCIRTSDNEQGVYNLVNDSFIPLTNA